MKELSPLFSHSFSLLLIPNISSSFSNSFFFLMFMAIPHLWFCVVFLFRFFRSSTACFGGGLGMLGCGMGPWGGGPPGAFGLNGLIGTDWSLGLGGGYAPFLGAYGAAPYTGAYSTGIYAAAPATALIGPCCASTFGGIIGFRRRKRTSDTSQPILAFEAVKSDHLQQEEKKHSLVKVSKGFHSKETTKI